LLESEIGIFHAKYLFFWHDAAKYFSLVDETDLTVKLTRILSDDPDINPNVDAGIKKRYQ
jgi:hypothetical protein